MINLRFLGAVEVRATADPDSSPIAMTPLQVAILSHLAASEPNGLEARGRLLELLWAARPSDEAARALTEAVDSLRAAVSEEVLRVGSDGGLALDEAWCTVDVRDFRRAIRAEEFEKAVAHYRGEFLEGLYFPRRPEFERWAEGDRSKLRRDATAGAFALVEAFDAEGDYAAAVERARWATTIAPADERVLRRLLELLDRHGDRVSAIREYESFTHRLAEEFGVSPSGEMLALMERMRSQPIRSASRGVTAERATLRDGVTASEAAVAESEGRSSVEASPKGPGVLSEEDEQVSQVRERLARSLAGRYRIEGAVGLGGMSIVFLAHDLRHERRVAIKILRPEFAEGIGVERFLNEIRIEASLDHPNVVPIYESGDADGLPYYVMPFFAGESLRQRLSREGQLPVDEALRITFDVAVALREAHARGVIHRDIKPANILLHEGRAVVTDFGVARALKEAGATRLTVTGISIGTPGYMSPEQATAEPQLDGRSDQYSLACVLHEMLAGESVFSGPSARSIIAKHVSLAPPPVRKLRPSVPEGVERAILTALEKPPVDRFASVDEFADAVRAGSGPASGSRRATVEGFPGVVFSRPWRTATVALGVTALAWIGFEVAGPDPRAWNEGRPESVVVLPFHTASSTDAERSVALDLADRIARGLNDWDPVRSVGRASLSGIIHDLGVTDATFQSSDAALGVARAAGTQGLVGITVQLRDDSVFADASLYDARSGSLLDRSLSAGATIDRSDDIVAAIVYGVLDLEGATGVARGGLHPGTRNPDALEANARGMEALARARLTDAEAHFRRAVSFDEDYSVALTHLALTLYWQAIDGGGRWDGVSPEITQWSTRAISSGRVLTAHDSLHVRGFYDFQLGDYEAARAAYDAILLVDPTDLHGWLMIGAIESTDPWAVAGPNGGHAPRGSLNRALAAFEETIRLQPDFELGYLRIFEVYQDVEEAIDLRACPTFEPLRNQLVPPWQTPSHELEQAFCPVVSDSVVWVAKADFDPMTTVELESGADRLFRSSVGMLERWAAFAPEAPRPREALADLIVTRRARERIAAPELLREYAAEALDHALVGLSLETDTVADDLIRVANLYLGAGRLDEAVETAEQGLSRLLAQDGTWIGRPPASAANVFLALGRPGLAHRIVSESYRGQSRFVTDSETGGRISYEGAVPAMMGAKVLGAGRVTGQRLSGQLRSLVEPWRSAGKSDRERLVLRNDATMRIAATLSLDPPTLTSWAEDVTVAQPLWRSLVLASAQPDTAHRMYREARATEVLSMTRAENTFTLAVAASRLGESREAIELYSRLDSMPHRLDGFDVGWGLQALSRLLRAEEMEKVRASAPAITELRAFLNAWEAPDSLAASQHERAREVLSRLGG